ncbi:helix-turn-helix domain-containing protein [Flavobacterium beibuense]|nr:helix-turn-helix domain-containing protein [Flavobacterium beibuense]
MKTQDTIRPLYKPIQSTVIGESLMYKELLPDFQLKDLIYCYWELKTTQKLSEAYTYNVVADGCIDVFFELNNPQNSYVMGFSNTNTEFAINKTFHYIGIRFLPTAFTRLFNVRATELTNRFESLYDVVPALSKFISFKIKDNSTHNEIASLLNDFFCNYLNIYNVDVDKRFFNAFLITLKHRGILNVETDLDTGISSRQLRRMFEHYVGTNVKTFCKVVRFQNLLNLSQQGSRNINKIFYDAGYYDQAHFIKDFKNLYGITPGKSLQK